MNSGGLATELTSNQYPNVEHNQLQKFVEAELLRRQARIVVEQAGASQGAESLLSEGTLSLHCGRQASTGLGHAPLSA